MSHCDPVVTNLTPGQSTIRAFIKVKDPHTTATYEYTQGQEEQATAFLARVAASLQHFDVTDGKFEDICILKFER